MKQRKPTKNLCMRWKLHDGLTSYYTPENRHEKETLWMFKLWKKVSGEAHILLDIRILSHTLKLMEIMLYNSIDHCIWNYQRTTAGLGLLPALNVIEYSTSTKLPSRVKSNQVISSATSWNLKMRTIISRLYKNGYLITDVLVTQRKVCAGICERCACLSNFIYKQMTVNALLWILLYYFILLCEELNLDQRNAVNPQIRQKQHLSHTWVYFLTNSCQRTQSM